MSLNQSGRRPGSTRARQVDRVKAVLYNKEEGYEIAGVAWFQGWNDVTNGKAYPNRGNPGSYDAYTEVLSHFIRDVR